MVQPGTKRHQEERKDLPKIEKGKTVDLYTKDENSRRRRR
jgi:hypothetical protein